MIDPQRAAASLRNTGAAVEAMAAGLNDDDARWRPADGAWSVLEVVCHLADEEREDFRARVRSTLDDPAAKWPSIDPMGWVRARRYNERSLATSMDDFARERAASLSWLADLRAAEADLAREYAHAKWHIRAGDVLASWVAHDVLHLRQLAELRYALAEGAAAPFSVQYAGEW